ncbi:GGDEF domain-containing protein [Rhodovulum bhavnagarense]|nr:GGDEF domain-containing protein [Rhodovulum bhavnagarense]
MTEPETMRLRDRVIGLSGSALDRLMPMHLWVGAGGMIVRAGPTLMHMAGGDPAGKRLDQVINVRHPSRVKTLDQLLRLHGVPLKLCLDAAPDLSLKGMAVALPGGGGAFVNLSAGVSLVEAVNRFDLTLGDFAATDLAAEQLYLLEAKAAVTGELTRLANRLNGARASAEARAATDTLTGLANRRGLDAMLARQVDSGRPFALMHIDLDHFKAVNDTHGHAAGDAVLCEAAAVLRGQCRARDMVARVGGDEFVMVFDDLLDPRMLRRIGQRLIERLEEPIRVGATTCRISASVGIALSNAYTQPDPVRLLHEADLALYSSKRGGRARVSLAR